MSGYGQGPFGAMPFGLGSQPPHIERWQPFPGDYVERVDMLGFDAISDTYTITAVRVDVLSPSGSLELAWNGDAFTERYRRGSGRKPVLNGHRFFLRRTGGWDTPIVNLLIRITDDSGDVTRVTLE